MPESKASATARAKSLGWPVSQVVRARTGGYYIAPRGITAAKWKHGYADCRAGGGSASTCAAVMSKMSHRRK